ATCSGKSALAMQLAEESGASIICCDSMQVYRGLDIGTAKADAAEQARVPHALLDCCDLPDAFSAARWAKQARTFICEENTRGRMPLIVGGTGLYLRALCEGLAEIPAENPRVRAQLQQQCVDSGIEALHTQLAEVDAATAARLPAGDTQRILRALSVFLSSGRPLSAWLADAKPQMAVNIPVFVLDVPREVLRERIAGRFQRMLAAGWLSEACWLDGLQLVDTHSALRAVGYRQLLAHIHGDCSLAEATEQGITATRHYAKRQRTWFAHQTPDAVRGDGEMLMLLIRVLLNRAVSNRKSSVNGCV
ncbi:MAG: tRNA (adenosine(37)-N6)-dimethylallyltransferase MiaA, partial [Mariprofundaceae bacterium]|nr:tRNA (adenosine(37)-N6)-dimethylallyltransferase MiaA [Mariprofundaceae bacterium]